MLYIYKMDVIIKYIIVFVILFLVNIFYFFQNYDNQQNQLALVNNNYINFLQIGGFVFAGLVMFKFFEAYFSSDISSKEEDYLFKNKYEYRNEPYLIEYINNYITNLDSLDFNFRQLYNNGNDISVYLKNKLNELLIGKYVVFHNILGYKNNNEIWKAETIDYSDTSKLIVFPKFSVDTKHNFIRENNEAMIIVKGNIIRIPEYGKMPPPQAPFADKSLSSPKKTFNYIYIFERNDLNKYKVKNTISLVKDGYTDINTNELNSEIQYVYYLGDKLLEDFIIQSDLKPLIILNKNNINKPIYYKNSVNENENKIYKKWLMDTYVQFINDQFKDITFEIIAEYKNLIKMLDKINQKLIKIILMILILIIGRIMIFII